MKKKLIVSSVIACLIWFLWAALEIIFYGKIQPRIVDDIIGVILLASIYKNLEQCM